MTNVPARAGNYESFDWVHNKRDSLAHHALTTIINCTLYIISKNCLLPKLPQ